jgi:chromosome partitioning protein
MGSMIISVANAKGGAGKSTTAAGLAGEGWMQGLKVLVIDADTQGNATEHLIGVGDPMSPQGDSGKSFRRLLLDGDELVPVRVRDGLDLVAGGYQTQALADDLARLLTQSLESKIEALRMLRESLHEATKRYDLVVIDTPPSEQSGALLDVLLAASDKVLIPCRASTEHSMGAFRLIQRLVALDALDLEVAQPVGIVMFDLAAGATRIAANFMKPLESVTGVVPMLSTVIAHRQGPAADASRLHLLPQELVSRGDAQVSKPVAAKFAADFAALFEELALAAVVAE